MTNISGDELTRVKSGTYNHLSVASGVVIISAFDKVFVVSMVTS